MGWCFRIFTIVIICMVLISFGFGYLKLYQLFVDITDTLSSIGQVNAFQDLAWIPFLVLQVCTTVFIILQIYCLIRELCEENYMYKYCFRCSFVLIVLIYCISVIPKSIMTIIYYNYDVAAEEWWNKVVDVLVSLFNLIGSLGFQIILFVPLLKKTLRKAGVCRKRAVHPSDARQGSQSNSDESDIVKTSCCLFSKSSKSKDAFKETDNGTDLHKTVNKQTKFSGVKQSVNDLSERKAKVERKMNDLYALKTKRETEMKQFVEKRKDKVMSKVKNNQAISALNKKKLQAKAKVTQVKTAAKQNADSVGRKMGLPTQVDSKPGSEIICAACGWTNKMQSHKRKKTDQIDAKNQTPGQLSCAKCASALFDPSTEHGDNDDNTKQGGCCRKFEEKMCCLCENRMACFFITFVLANVHLVIYVIELLFIFCPWCYI